MREKTLNELCEEIRKIWITFIEERIFPLCKDLCELILWTIKKLTPP